MYDMYDKSGRRTSDLREILKSDGASVGHGESVVSLFWSRKASAKGRYELVSCSRDGTGLYWDLGDRLVRPSAGFILAHQGDVTSVRSISCACATRDSGVCVGTETGNIMLCSRCSMAPQSQADLRPNAKLKYSTPNVSAVSYLAPILPQGGVSSSGSVVAVVAGSAMGAQVYRDST
ncbi:hypothetical protein KIPB_011235, partial [Kipferlia bialata]|eukprot:g11235.t1